jgi:hypothetical protein
MLLSVMPGLVPGKESRARSRFGLMVPVFLRAFCGPDSALDKIYFN